MRGAIDAIARALAKSIVDEMEMNQKRGVKDTEDLPGAAQRQAPRAATRRRPIRDSHIVP